MLMWYGIQYTIISLKPVKCVNCELPNTLIQPSNSHHFSLKRRLKEKKREAWRTNSEPKLKRRLRRKCQKPILKGRDREDRSSWRFSPKHKLLLWNLTRFATFHSLCSKYDVKGWISPSLSSFFFTGWSNSAKGSDPERGVRCGF